MRILIADDDEEILAMAGFLLERAGAVVLPALGGAAALRLAAAERPDAVISDYRMADMDGFALLRALRALPGLERLPFLLCTGKAGPAFRAEALAAGAGGVLPKPFDPERFAGEALGLLSRARGTGAG